MRRLPKSLKVALQVIVLAFALWGFLLTGVFFAMKLGLTKSSSLIDQQSAYFAKLAQENSGNDSAKVLLAEENFTPVENLPEYKTISLGILKDTETIEKVSELTGVPARLIVTPLVVEQLRLMTSQREIFKNYFQPLAVLGSQTQFSLGIYGIKEATAKQIEANLKNLNSPYYLGAKYANLLDYPNSSSSLLVYADTLEPVKSAKLASSTNSSSSSSTRKTILLQGNDALRIKRLTNEQDHYYSYLYAALYIKQLLNSWSEAGFPIQARPEIVATLYNIGFKNSHPNANPAVGGSEIDLDSQKYTFGALAFYFYYSDALINVFPR